jgi:hypothetical protein
VKRWKATAHGRWEGEWQARSGLDMTDLYDATGTDRKLEVTEAMSRLGLKTKRLVRAPLVIFFLAFEKASRPVDFLDAR